MSQVLAGSDASVQSVTAALEKLEASAVSSVCGWDPSFWFVARLIWVSLFLPSQAAQSLLKGKPTYVVVGDVNELPYADEVGL